MNEDRRPWYDMPFTPVTIALNLAVTILLSTMRLIVQYTLDVEFGRWGSVTVVAAGYLVTAWLVAWRQDRL